MNDATRMELEEAKKIGPKNDKGAKSLWSNKEIVAPLLSLLIPEYKGMSTAEVMGCIEGEIRDDSESVNDFDPGSDSMYIDGSDTTLSSQHEKDIHFDKFFTIFHFG